MAYTSKIEILRPREVKDRYSSGATSLDYSDPEVIDVEKRVELQPVSSREQGGDGRFSVVSGWLLVTQTGVDLDLRDTDRVRFGDRVLGVIGSPLKWPHPVKPNGVHHVEATLEEVTG